VSFPLHKIRVNSNFSRRASASRARKLSLGEFVPSGRYHDDHAETQILREQQELLRHGRLGGVVGDLHEVHPAAPHDAHEVPKRRARVVRRPDGANLPLLFQAVEGVESPLDGDEVVNLVELDATAELA
jgi:hypothetical protein